MLKHREGKRSHGSEQEEAFSEGGGASRKPSRLLPRGFRVFGIDFDWASLGRVHLFLGEDPGGASWTIEQKKIARNRHMHGKWTSERRSGSPCF
eukprot:9158990-Pyramimonas_sp.AAC.2